MKEDIFGVAKIGKAVFVSITRRRGEIGVSGKPVADIDVTRGYWSFRGNAIAKAQQCETLVAVVRSVIVGVWMISPNAWQRGPASGVYRLVWDAGSDLPNGYRCEKLSISVRVADNSKKFMIVDLSSGAITYQATAPEGGWNVDEYKGTKMAFVRIEPGTFTQYSIEGIFTDELR